MEAVLGSALLGLLVLLVWAALALLPGLARAVMGSDPAGREAELDGLRGLLALGVFLHHGVVMRGFLAGGPWALPAHNFDSLAGQGAVALFFMTSSYLFWGRVVRARGLLDGPSFYAGRVRRLVPMYAATFAVFCVIVAVQTQFTRHVPVEDLVEQGIRWSSFSLMDLVVVNGLPSTFMIWSVTWTLQYEWLFYLVLPFFAFAYRALRWPVLLYAAAVLMAYLFPSLIMVLFFAGGAVSVHAIPVLRRFPWAGWIVSVAGAAAVPILIDRFHVAFAPRPAALLFLIFVASLSGKGPWAVLRSKPTRFLGHISYSVYLLHNPILYAVAFFVIGPRAYGALSPLALHCVLLAIGVLVITVSTATFLFIEKPFLSRAVSTAAPAGPSA